MAFDVSHIAKLANLPLTEEEKKKFEKQLEETLSYISQVTGLENVERDDITTPSLTQEQALKNAPKTEKGFFVVESILKQD